MDNQERRVAVNRFRDHALRRRLTDRVERHLKSAYEADAGYEPAPRTKKTYLSNVMLDSPAYLW
jgi:hypothetical protein